jgi:hypothetical protein
MASLLSNSVYLRSHSAVSGKHVNVGMMTSGGLAPCLSASIAMLSKYWIKALRDGEISGLTLRMYIDGYAGVLTGKSIVIPEEDWDKLVQLVDHGGSPIGNSRVKVCCSVCMCRDLSDIVVCVGCSSHFFVLFLNQKVDKRG